VHAVDSLWATALAHDIGTVDRIRTCAGKAQWISACIDNYRSKTLLARLPKASLEYYTKVRDYLLREFRLTQENYRDKFWSATKNRNETFTLFGKRVKTLFQ